SEYAASNGRQARGASLAVDAFTMVSAFTKTARQAPRRPPSRARLRPSLGELAHAQNVALPLGHRDHAAGIEQIEHVARLDALVIRGQRHAVAARVALGRPAGVQILAAGGLRPAGLLEQAARLRSVGIQLLTS